MRVIPLILLLILVAGLTPAQNKLVTEPNETTAKDNGAAKKSSLVSAVAKLRVSFKAVMGLGKPGASPLGKLRRYQKVKTAVSLVRFVSRRLRRAPTPEHAVDPKEIQKICETFSADLDAVVVLGEKVLDDIRAAIASSESFEKKFLEKVEGRLLVQAAYAEINSYFVNDQSPGTFDGMFPKTAKLKREGALAMLDLFIDLDQATNVRLLAGEGVAQLGSKEDIPSVTEVYDDPLEDAKLKRKAMFVLARLGQRAPFEKEAEKIRKLIAEAEKKRDAARKNQAAARKEYKALVDVEAPTPAQKEEIAKLEKRMRELSGQTTNHTYNCGRLHVAIAVLYLEIRDHSRTAEGYIAALKNWNAIAGILFREPDYRRQVANAYYNLACIQSLQDSTKASLKTLESCFRWGYADYAWCEKDGDLANLRKNEGFAKLMAEVKSGEAMKRWKAEAAEARKKQEAAKKAAADKAKADGTAPDGE